MSRLQGDRSTVVSYSRSSEKFIGPSENTQNMECLLDIGKQYLAQQH